MKKNECSQDVEKKGSAVTATEQWLKHGYDLSRGYITYLVYISRFNLCLTGKNVIVPLGKRKYGKSECENMMEVNLRIPGKMLGKIVIERVQEMTMNQIWEVHCRFFFQGRECQ